MERTDADGVWQSDDGVSWALVEPSEAFRASVGEPAEVRSPEQIIRAEIAARLDDPSVNSIAEMKAAILDGLDAAAQS